MSLFQKIQEKNKWALITEESKFRDKLIDTIISLSEKNKELSIRLTKLEENVQVISNQARSSKQQSNMNSRHLRGLNQPEDNGVNVNPRAISTLNPKVNHGANTN